MTNGNIEFTIREYAKITNNSVSEINELVLSKDTDTMNGLFKLASKNPELIK